jgi:hypothetical protein
MVPRAMGVAAASIAGLESYSRPRGRCDGFSKKIGTAQLPVYDPCRLVRQVKEFGS